jgi:hypothetical protein
MRPICAGSIAKNPELSLGYNFDTGNLPHTERNNNRWAFMAEIGGRTFGMMKIKTDRMLVPTYLNVSLSTRVHIGKVLGSF